MAEKTAFLEVFPCCGVLKELCGGLENTYLTSVLIDREALAMQAAHPWPAGIFVILP